MELQATEAKFLILKEGDLSNSTMYKFDQFVFCFDVLHLATLTCAWLSRTDLILISIWTVFSVDIIMSSSSAAPLTFFKSSFENLVSPLKFWISNLEVFFIVSQGTHLDLSYSCTFDTINVNIKGRSVIIENLMFHFFLNKWN